MKSFTITQKKTLASTRKAGFTPRSTLVFKSKRAYDRKVNKKIEFGS